MENKKENPKFKFNEQLTQQGSLGLLAYGDLGLIAWRESRSKIQKDQD